MFEDGDGNEMARVEADATEADLTRVRMRAIQHFHVLRNMQVSELIN